MARNRRVSALAGLVALLLGGDVGPAPLGFVFEIAPRRPSDRIPPAFIDMYGAAWVVDPR